MGKFLVTGGAGSVGSSIVDRLVESGHDVVSADLVAGRSTGARHVAIDLTVRESLEDLVTDIDGLIHCAAIPDPVSRPRHVVFSNNVVGAFNLLEASLDAGVRKIVNLSSECVYGFGYPRYPVSPNHLPLLESDPLLASDAYGLGKIVVEQLLDAYARELPDLIAWSLRAAWVLGPDEYSGFSTVSGLETRRRSGVWAYIDRDDLTTCAVAAIESRQAGHRVLNVASPDNLVGDPLGELAARKFGPGVEVDEPDSSRSGLDTSAAHRHLGFVAQHRWQDRMT